MKDVFKKHQYLKELTKTTFKGELEPIGLELLEKLHLFSCQTPAMFHSFSTQRGFFNTYAEKEWRIEIKAKNGKQRFVIKEQQVVLQMLPGIESVLAQMPNVSTDKKLQREIFKLALPYYRKCRLLDNNFQISNFDIYLQDYVHGQFEKDVAFRSFEKWFRSLRGANCQAKE